MGEAAVQCPEPYDPLDYDNLAQNVVRALMAQPCVELPPPAAFEGSGVYALYYLGDLDYYANMRGKETPIYVGSAVPAGKRKGGAAKSAAERKKLYNRLGQHAKSVDTAKNLSVADFRCRYLVVVPVWIGLAERFLIKHYHPVWNTVVDGFGNHAPGGGRSSMKRPRWDILHPGRAWAQKLAAAEDMSDIIGDLGC